MLLIALVAIVSLWIRYHVANSDPLWLDELHSVWVVEHDTSDVYQAAAMGNQAPLYFWLLKTNPFLNTESPLSIRWLSVLCGALATASIGFFIYYWTRGVPASVLGALLSALEPNLIFYGSEARPYALLMLIAIWQFFGFSLYLFKDEKAVQVDSPGREQVKSQSTILIVGLFILSLLLVLTHHTGALLLGTEFAILTGLCFARRVSRRQWAIVGGLLLVTGAIVLTAQRTSISTTFAQRFQWASITSTSELFRAYLPSLIYLILIPLAIWGVTYWKGYRENANLVTLTICTLAWCVLPDLIAGFSDELGFAPLALYRYTLVGAIAIPIFAGLAVSKVPNAGLQTIVACAVLALSIFGPLPPDRENKPNRYNFANKFLVQNGPKLVSGNSVRMRYESWDSVANLISRSDAPVFLFANLLEDQALASQSDSNNIASEEQVRYLKFPLTCFRQIDENKVIPRPSHSGMAFRMEDVERAVQAREIWVVLRGDPMMFKRIHGELASHFREHSPTFDFFRADRTALEWLHVIHVELR